MNKYHVLLVEDESSDRLIISLAFRKVAPDVNLHCLTDGEEAIAYLTETHPLPQLVLLDLKLPRCSGLQVLTWIRSRQDLKTLPVILLTASSEGADLQKAIALGATSYLVKSVDVNRMRELIKGVREYVGRLVADESVRSQGGTVTEI